MPATYQERDRAREKARDAMVHGAYLLTDGPFTMEQVAAAIGCAAIAIVHLAKVDHEDRAKDLLVEAIRAEQKKRAEEPP